MRKLFLPVVLALVAAACGGNAEPTSSPATTTESATAETAPSTTIPTSTEVGGEAPGDAAAGDTTEAGGSSFDGPSAPDFELLLNDGSTFRLSDEEKPVYMVFWAEW
jgi:hypothetical protein